MTTEEFIAWYDSKWGPNKTKPGRPGISARCFIEDMVYLKTHNLSLTTRSSDGAKNSHWVTLTRFVKRVSVLNGSCPSDLRTLIDGLSQHGRDKMAEGSAEGGRNSWQGRFGFDDPSILPPNWPFVGKYTSPDSDGLDIILAIDKAVPQGIAPQVREDLCQDLAVAVIMGKLQLANLKDAAKPFIKKAFSQYSYKYGDRSLSAPLITDSSFTLESILRSNIESTGICSRCENTDEDLKDGVCGPCWETMERDLKQHGTGQYRGLPVFHGYTKRTIDRGKLEDYLEDTRTQDGHRWTEWKPSLDREIVQSSRYSTKQKIRKAQKNEEFIVGPRKTRLQADKRGHFHIDKRSSYTYRENHPTGLHARGDEAFRSES